MGQETDEKQYFLVVFVYSLVIMAFAQFKAGILIPNFTVSFGIILLPFLYTIIDDFPIIPVSVFSGLFIAVTRFLAADFSGGPAGDFAAAYLPEMFFYMLYAFLLCFYCDDGRRKPELSDYLAVTVFIDALSNMVELTFRRSLPAWEVYNVLCVLGVAAFRTGVLAALLKLFYSCQLRLMHQSDVRMYRQLLITMTRLAGETTWMQENMQLAERTMTDAYQLYDGLKAQGEQKAALQALSVATNVHEIKKQYHALSESLSAAMEQTREQERMEIAEIAGILLSMLKNTARKKGIALEYEIDCPKHLSTRQYYRMMSVFNNLFTNALEAARGDSEQIRVAVTEEEGGYRFCVSNNGKQIAKESLADIWEAGYSTKIDYRSGVIGRGLGLLIVREILEREFGAGIEVFSDEDTTSFVFFVPGSKLEVGV